MSWLNKPKSMLETKCRHLFRVLYEAISHSPLPNSTLTRKTRSGTHVMNGSHTLPLKLKSPFDTSAQLNSNNHELQHPTSEDQ